MRLCRKILYAVIVNPGTEKNNRKSGIHMKKSRRYGGFYNGEGVQRCMSERTRFNTDSLMASNA